MDPGRSLEGHRKRVGGVENSGSGLRGKNNRKLIIKHCACVEIKLRHVERHLSAASNDIKFVKFTCKTL